jgi:arylsulfatase A
MRFHLSLLAALVLAHPVRAANAPGRPNFVVVICDDLGYGELACYGSKIAKTPHLDRFAAQGLKLNQCYAGHPNCSPSRAALMTGRIPFRAGIHNWIPQGSPMHLKGDEITLARLLQMSGYATCLVGKWHLSGGFDLAGQPTPAQHGFDHWFATQNVAVPSHRDPENFFRNGKALGKLTGCSAQIVAAEAADWLAHQRDKNKPFFLFVSLHEPHEKIATDPRFLDLFPSPDDPTRAEFWGNIAQLDDAFGRLMKTLDDLKLADDTLVFFTSDNGAALTKMHPHGSTGGLRGKKSMVYEGGVRVPGLLRWPGRTRPGQASDEPVSGIDVLPTFCALGKIAPPANRAIDGASFVPVLEGKAIPRKTPLYWQFHRADSPHKVAVRQGDWKLYATLTGPQLGSSGDILQEDLDSLNEARLGSFALFHLGKDREEKNDLAAIESDRVVEMSGTMRKLFDEVRKESPRWPIWRRFPAKK